MAKIGVLLLLLMFAGIAYAMPDVDALIPKGWQKGNGLDKTPFPFYIKMDIDRDSEKEIILHYSYKEKGDYLPSKHILSIFDWNGKKYFKKWSRKFNESDNIFFLIKDINGDKKQELIVNGYNSGNAGLGHLWILPLTKSDPTMIFDKNVQGDIYLWNSEELAPGLEPDYFPDLDKDGVVEILVGHREEECNNVYHCEAEKPWWFDVYKWDGKTYVTANNRFPGFYGDMLAYYQSIIKEKGECESVKGFIKKAERLAGL